MQKEKWKISFVNTGLHTMTEVELKESKNLLSRIEIFVFLMEMVSQM